MPNAWEPHPGQREFLDSPAKIKVLACGRRWGKTDVCAAAIVRALAKESPTRHLILAPTADQSTLLFEKVAAMAGRGTSRRTPHPTLKVGEHRVIARSGHLGRSLRGNEATHLVVDEAAYLPEALITEVAMPMLATTDGEMALISTPNGLNHFWRFFQMGQRDEHGVWSRSAPSWESPYVSARYLEVQRELISERAFRVEYGAEFLDSAGRIFRTEAIERCLTTRLPEAPETVVVGVDWGRYQDCTAVAVLAGDREEAWLVEMEAFQGLGWGDQVERVGRLLDRYPRSLVLCDGTGLGDPLVDFLRRRAPTCPIKRVAFTSGVKASLIDGLAWLIDRGALRMRPDPALLRELQHFEAVPREGGPPRLEALAGYHDDRVVALALAASALGARGHSGVRLIGRR